MLSNGLQGRIQVEIEFQSVDGRKLVVKRAVERFQLTDCEKMVWVVEVVTKRALLEMVLLLTDNYRIWTETLQLQRCPTTQFK